MTYGSAITQSETNHPQNWPEIREQTKEALTFIEKLMPVDNESADLSQKTIEVPADQLQAIQTILQIAFEHFQKPSKTSDEEPSPNSYYQYIHD